MNVFQANRETIGSRVPHDQSHIVVFDLQLREWFVGNNHNFILSDGPGGEMMPRIKKIADPFRFLTCKVRSFYFCITHRQSNCTAPDYNANISLKHELRPSLLDRSPEKDKVGKHQVVDWV